MKRPVPITVAIPVGPHPSNVEWLAECRQSLAEQSRQPMQVLLIDDGAHLEPDQQPGTMARSERYTADCYRTPWASGVAHAFNFGVGLAEHDLVLMLGSDDRLLPTCVEQCWHAWQERQDPLGYYYLGLEYNDGTQQNTPCNAAMVHKALWRHTGGFPVESAIGMPDTWLISLLLVSGGGYGHLYSVAPEPLYWYRQHEQTDTNRRRGLWHGLATAARSAYLEERLA